MSFFLPVLAQTESGNDCERSRHTPRGPSSRGVFVCLPIPEGNPATMAGAQGLEDPLKRGPRYGSRTSKVVQRRKGVWVYHAGGRRGRICPLQRHSSSGVQEP